MNNESTSGKISMPEFLKIPIVMRTKTDSEINLGEKQEYVKGEARINPTLISSYSLVKYGEGEDSRSATCVYVSGISYFVDMEINEFDKIIGNLDRGYNVEAVTNIESVSLT